LEQVIAMGRRLATAAIVALAWTGIARADDLAPFNAAIENAAAHNRVALSYLRTENTDLATIELEQMKEAWAAMAERFAGNRPAPFRDSELFNVALVDVPTRIVGAFIMINFGRPDIAAQSLQAIREELSAMRRAAGVEVLADRILDANVAFADLAGPRDSTPDWEHVDYGAKSERYRTALARCDAMADPDTRKSPEFRRLVDGATAGLALIPETVRDRDGDRLHRILIELRAFDHLLTFHYG
jgi:hypothetical protein